MDPSRFQHHQFNNLHQHHQHRYNTLPQPPLPPLPPPPQLHTQAPTFQEPPQFYDFHHHHHRDLPQLPLPPPPPPLSPPPPPYHTFQLPPPPPPSHNPHQSCQYTFRYPNPNPNPNFPVDSHHHHHGPTLDFNRFPSRVHDYDLRGGGADIWESSPIVLPENNMILGEYPAADLNHGSRHRVFGENPVKTSSYTVLDKLGHDFNDGYLRQHQKEEFVWDGINHHGKNDHYGTGSRFVKNHDIIGSSVFGNSQVSDLNLSSSANMGNFEPRYSSDFDGQLFRYTREDGVRENQVWDRIKQPLSDLPNSFSDVGIDRFGDADKALVFSRKRASRDSEFGNFDSEGTNEYNCTPSRQIQKKSAFLRIQMRKPNSRSRDNSQVQSFGHYDESTSSPFRSKGSPVYPSRRNKDEERKKEGSPVELDVSFKSNLLVAKPIVTPSSPAVSSGRSLTPNNSRKIRKLTYSDKDNLTSPNVIGSEGCLKSENLMDVSNSPSNPLIDANQQEGTVVVSSIRSLGVVFSKPLSSWTNISSGKRKVKKSAGATALAEGRSTVSFSLSGKNSLPKVTSKNVNGCHSNSSNAQLETKLIKPVQTGISIHCQSAIPRSDEGLTQSKENNTCAGKVSRCSDDVQPAPSEINILPKSQNHVANNGKHPCADGSTISIESGGKEGSPNAIVSTEGNISVASSKESSPNNVRIKKLSSLPLNSFSPSKSDVSVVSLNRAVTEDALDITASTFKNFTPADTEITACGSGDSEVDLELSTDKFSDMQSKTSLDMFSREIFEDGVTPSLTRVLHKSNKRKLFAPNTAFSSQFGSEIHEFPAAVDTFTSGARFLLNSDYGLTQIGQDAHNVINAVYTAGLVSCPNGKAILCDNTGARESLEELDDALILEVPRMDSGATIKVSVIQNMLSPCPLEMGCEQTEKDTSPTVTKDQDNVNMVIESIKEEETVVCFANDQAINDEISQESKPLELQTTDLNQTFCYSDMECDSLTGQEDFPSTSNLKSLSTSGDGVSTSDLGDDGINTLPDVQSNMGSPESLSTVHDQHMSIPKLSRRETCHEIVSGADKILEEKSSVGTGSLQETKTNHLFTVKHVLLPPRDFKTTSTSQNQTHIDAIMRKKQQTYLYPRLLPGRASVFINKSGKTISSTHITKPGTWRRDSNPSAASPPETKISSTVSQLNQSSKTFATVQTPYIRKGNSLVRKPSQTTAPQSSLGVTTSTYRLTSSGIGNYKKITGSDIRVDLNKQSNSSRIGGLNAAPPKLQIVTKPHSPGHISYQLTDPPISACVVEKPSESVKLREDKDVTNYSDDAPDFIGISENHSGPRKSLGSHGGYEKSLASSKLGKVIYVKHKSNQLVAASNPCNRSGKSTDKTNLPSSDGSYYKKKKNKLIRTAHESPFSKQVSVHHDSSNSKAQRARRVTSGKSSSKRWSDKVFGTYRPSKLSLVWKLPSTEATQEIDKSRSHHKVFPRLLPWKRRTYWKEFLHNSSKISSNNNLSAARKLLVLRNRGAVYTRSTRGFSLRKSKVLSVGGRSLKWSMSIEKRSKKANEEATLAVAAAEKKKREENSATSLTCQTNSRNKSSRECIYRIGSVRYKMDASKRTLQRILDDDTSSSAVQQERDAKKPYVPRRLVIGNDEYVRIGNGNQLIRDPKKRTRALASEKVRWSLHTARLRLAKKSKYCQFFTRFGTCNKDNGKCPYAHDQSKITVCTKFLKGLCSNPNCKLTHKVIPERMQDCSYFLQGLCSNEICPYRHVNVNPNASTCEGFLRGYCADGNECRKKHSYVCPVFETSGSCPQGSKCKLHHPKEKTRGKKRKRLTDQNALGRYFGSPKVDVAESDGVVPEKLSTKKNDETCLSDYISLDVSDEDIGDIMDVSQDFDDVQSLDEQVDDLNDLVPIRLIK